MSSPLRVAWKRLSIKRPISPPPSATALPRALGIGSLLGLGLGAIIGTGIFVLLGLVTSTYAGPGTSLSFVLAGVTVMLVALLYAELASMMPESGSSYVYVFTAFGELTGWLVGWTMLLTVAAAPAAAAIGWVGYFSNLLSLLNLHPPAIGVSGANLPAALLALAATALVVRGVQTTARVNAGLVLVKIGALLVFLGMGARHVTPANWTPFLPFGWEGVLAGGGVLLFAYFGFDVLASTAEEAQHPQKSLPVAILGSLIVSALLYVSVSLVFTGMIPQALYPVLARQAAPLAFALDYVGQGKVAFAVSLGAVAGITTLLLAITLCHSRIMLAIARDGLLPRAIAKLGPKGSPDRATLVSGTFVTLLAGFAPLEALAGLATLGALLTFSLVALGAWRLRRTHPESPRAFRAPFLPMLAMGTLVACLALLATIPRPIGLMLVAWLGVGLLVYACYGFRHSRLGQQSLSPPSDST